jgi:hypothetical protein
MINNLDTYKVKIQIENKILGLQYGGKANTLLNFIGLEEGIKQVYNKLKN